MDRSVLEVLDYMTPFNEKQKEWGLEELFFLNTNRIEGFLFKKMSINPIKLNSDIYRDAKVKYHYNKERYNRVVKTILPKIIKLFERNNINYAFTKGIATIHTLSLDPGIRFFSDIDIIVSKKQLRIIKNVLEESDFQQGRYFIDNFYPAERKIIITNEISTHQTFPYVYKVDDQLVNEIYFDINFGLARVNKLSDVNFIENLLNRKQNIIIDSTTAAILSNEDLLLHLCVHTYRDMNSIYHILNKTDIRLYQLFDLNETIKQLYNKLDWKYIIETCEQYQIVEFLYQPIYFCSLLFPNKQMLEKILDIIPIKTKDFIDEFGYENKSKSKWDISFVDRLFMSDRASYIKNNYEDKKFVEALKFMSLVE